MQLTIGQVAKLGDVSVQTLRYYERRGILQPVDRRDSGYRVYDNQAVRTVRFIKRAQALGFSLDDIQELLSLKLDRKSKCNEVQRHAVWTLEEVEKKLSRLETIKRALETLKSDCDAQKVTADGACPILDSFESKLPRVKRLKREVV